MAGDVRKDTSDSVGSSHMSFVSSVSVLIVSTLDYTDNWKTYLPHTHSR